MHVPLDTPTEYATWNQPRFNKRRLARRILAHPLTDSTLRQPGFVHTRGDHGWLLLGPVLHDGDLYRRHDPDRGTIYGSISALLEEGMPEVELLNEADVLRAGIDHNLCLAIERESDGARLDVAMLHPWPTPARPRSCAVFLNAAGALAVLNPELSARYNKPNVRWRILHPLTNDALPHALRQRLASLQARPPDLIPGGIIFPKG